MLHGRGGLEKRWFSAFSWSAQGSSVAWTKGVVGNLAEWCYGRRFGVGTIHYKRSHSVLVEKQQTTMIGAKAYLEVLGTHSEETLPSVMITINDTTRLLFNVGEGLIRSCTEHGVKATRASHLFITHLSSDALSEFTTFFLRSHLTGTRTTHICGPPNLANFIFTNRYLVNRNHLIVLTECEGGEKIARGDDWPVVETIGIKSTVPFSDPATPAKVPPTVGLGSAKLSGGKLHQIRGKESTFAEFLHFMKFRGGLIDGFRHLDKEMHVQFLAKYPHPQGGEIPPDFYGEVSSNNAPSDKSQMNLRTRHFHMELRSPRMLRQTQDERMARFQTRADIFVNEPVFGPIRSLVYTIPPVQKEFTALSYIIRTPAIKGTFDAKKAAALGVPRGPLFGKLQKGEPIVTPEGKEVFSEQVMSPSVPGPIFAVICCPHVTMITDLSSNATWKSLKDNNENVSVAVHFGPRHVVDTDEYKSFLASFGDSCQHIFVGQGMCRDHPIYTASMTQTSILNVLSSRWFPLPYLGDSTPALPENLPKKSIQGDHYMKFVGVPREKMGLHTGDCLPCFDASAVRKEYAKIAENSETPNPDAVAPGFSEKELEIVFLGTGCSAASSLRNETAIYLDFFEKGGMLMDVGIGTYGQMYRKYGPTKIVEVLSNLKVIWISHMHADHVQGIVRVLHMRHKAIMESGKGEERVLILGPHTLFEILREHMECIVCTCKYKKEHHPEFTFNFVDSYDLRDPSPILKDYFGLEEVFSVSVLHAFMSQALMMKHVNGWSLVFSGDTAYCPNLIDRCRSPTVLIHEASFEDTELAKAAAKAHCTTSQAIETGERMNAKCTLLTHFSQRYRNLTLETQLHNVSPAFDFMCVNLADHMAVSKYGAKLASLGKLDTLVGAGEDEYVDLE